MGGGANENPRSGYGAFKGEARLGGGLDTDGGHVDEAHQQTAGAGIVQAPIIDRVAKVMPSTSGKLRREALLPQCAQKQAGRQRRMQNRPAAACKLPRRPCGARLIRLRPVHVERAGLDLKARCPLGHPEMQNRVRLRPGDGLPRRSPSLRPLDRNYSCEQFDARQRSRLLQRLHHIHRSVSLDAWEWPEAGYQHASRWAGLRGRWLTAEWRNERSVPPLTPALSPWERESRRSR